MTAESRPAAPPPVPPAGLPPTLPADASGAARWVPFIVAASFFMEMLDATVITTALPEMAQSFGVEPARLSIGLSAYMLALAVFIPVSGWVADRYGPRRVFSAAIVVFTFASLLCGLSETLWQFTAARVLQGLGGALMVPVGRLVVLRLTAKKDLVRAIATITWPGLAAPVIGPPIGALITTHLSWHWIFYLNLPLGALALIASLRMIRGEPGGPRPFDWLGFVLSGIGCSALMTSLELASHTPIELGATLALLVLGIGALVATVWHMRRAAHPLVDLGGLREPTFAVTVYGGSLFRTAIGSAPFLLPLMFQLAFGMSAVTAGWLLLALFAGNLGMKPGTSWVMRRFGFRGVLLGNGLLVVIGFAACAMFTAETPPLLIAAVLVFCGACRSMQFTAMNTVGFADIAPAQMSGATTLFSVFQQMNAGMGVAFGALALRIGEAVVGGEPGAASAGAFRIAFALVAVLALLAMIDSLRLTKDAGAEVSGHRRAA